MAFVQRLVLVPGFTQTASSWGGVVDALADAYAVRVVDMPQRATFTATASAIGEQGERAAYVGYSMGGRLCLQLAVDRPDLVDALVLVSASPGLDDDAERAARVASDEELARSVERDGVDRFLESWLEQPMFRSVPPNAPGLADRRALTPAFLAHCLRVLGTGTMAPLWDRLHELQMPVALVTGRADAKFDAIAGRMVERMHADVVDRFRLDGGHAVPLERPAELADAIATFVTRHVHR